MPSAGDDCRGIDALKYSVRVYIDTFLEAVSVWQEEPRCKMDLLGDVNDFISSKVYYGYLLWTIKYVFRSILIVAFLKSQAQDYLNIHQQWLSSNNSIYPDKDIMQLWSGMR